MPDSTLRNFLTHQKPTLVCTSTATRNSSREDWPRLAGRVVIWNEFNLENLNKSYGHVLDTATDELPECPPFDELVSGNTAKSDDDIKHLLSWNARLMEPTLKLAKAQLRLIPGVRVKHTYSVADRNGFAHLPNAPPRQVVDHIIELDEFPGAILVVGLVRVSSKWSGRQLAAKPHNPKKELLWPVRQLANICDVAQTRYGYIQTDEELVACCFSKNGESWKAAIMPIPWTKSGVEVLTTDLALWWLCMLAMSSRQSRSILREEETVKIDEWEICQDGQQGPVRRHRYSGFEKPVSDDPLLNFLNSDSGTDLYGANPHDSSLYDTSLYDFDAFNLDDVIPGHFVHPDARSTEG